MTSSGTIWNALADLASSPRVAGFGAVASTAALLAVAYKPELTGISDIPSVWKAAIFIVAICCWSALVIQTTAWILFVAGSKKRKAERLQRLSQELQQLTRPEYVVLAYAARNNEPIVTLPMQSAIAANLRQRGIIDYIAGPVNLMNAQFLVANDVREIFPDLLTQMLNNEPAMQGRLDNELQHYIDYLREPLYHHRDWL